MIRPHHYMSSENKWWAVGWGKTMGSEDYITTMTK